MEGFITSGRIADVILAAMAAEVLVMSVLLWRRNQGLAMLAHLASVLSGASLVLALKNALTDPGWTFIAAYLFAGLLAHLAEIALRVLAARDAA
jgi:hypothetical protein